MTAILYVDSDEENDDNDELQVHGGNVIPNWNNIRGLGKREYSSAQEAVNWLREEEHHDNAKEFKRRK